MFKAISMFFELLFNLLEGSNKGAKSYNVVMGTLVTMSKSFDKEKKLEQKIKDLKFNKTLAKAKLENAELDTSDFDKEIEAADAEIEANKESKDSK